MSKPDRTETIALGDLIFQYDEVKNQKNIRKHHISIPELATIFINMYRPCRKDRKDPRKYYWHGKREIRYNAYGWTTTGWYVRVWYTYRNGMIRIIGGKRVM